MASVLWTSLLAAVLLTAAGAPARAQELLEDAGPAEPEEAEPPSLIAPRGGQSLDGAGSGAGEPEARPEEEDLDRVPDSEGLQRTVALLQPAAQHLRTAAEEPARSGSAPPPSAPGIFGPVSTPAPGQPLDLSAAPTAGGMTVGFSWLTLAAARGQYFPLVVIYRFEEPTSALSQFLYDAHYNASWKTWAEFLSLKLPGAAQSLGQWLPEGGDSWPSEYALRLYFHDQFPNGTEAYYKAMYGTTAMMGKEPLWLWMMRGKEIGMPPATYDDRGRQSARANSSAWSGGTYHGPVYTNLGLIQPGDPRHAQALRLANGG